MSLNAFVRSASRPSSQTAHPGSRIPQRASSISECVLAIPPRYNQIVPTSSTHPNPDTASTIASPRRRRTWLFRILAVVLGPLLFLGLVEFGLRIGGYGYETGFFVKDEATAMLATNQRFGWRFFPPVIARTPDDIRLAARKPAGTYRVFVLGGSAAMGFPDRDFSFGCVLEVMLRETFPGTRFEVLNAAMTAINSHVVVEIARDCARPEPDLFVLYLGNNEIVGPFGPGTVFAGFSQSRPLIRASVRLKASRLGQLAGDLIGGLGGGGARIKEWRSMEMFLDKQVRADDSRLGGVYDHLRANLADIFRTARGAGAAVVLSTVAVNLKDNAPFLSLHRADISDDAMEQWRQTYESAIDLDRDGKTPEAIQKYDAAAHIDDQFAELHFRLAQCHRALGQLDKARDHFVKALDLDALRFRADSGINRAIRQAAEDHPTVHLVDAQATFVRSTSDGIVGNELLHEHVHMNVHGNFVLARAVFEAVVPLLPESIRGANSDAPGPPDEAECARLLVLTLWDQYRHAEKIKAQTAIAPFTNQFDHGERAAAQQRRLRALGLSLTPDALAEAASIYDSAVANDPDDLSLRRRLAQLHSDRRDHNGAAVQWGFLAEQRPDDVDAHNNLGLALVAKGRIEEGIEHYQRALELRPQTGATHLNLGIALGLLGRTEKAIEHYVEAVRLEPDHADAHNNLGNAYRSQGRTDDALHHLRLALEARPDYGEAHNNLGVLLLEQGETDEAIKHFSAALAARPDLAEVHLNLAAARRAQGHPDAAIDHYRQALQIDSDMPLVHTHLGTLLGSQGRHDEAIHHLRQAVRIRPNDADAHYALGAVLKRAGRPRAALDQFRQAVQLRADWPLPLNDLAWLIATHADLYTKANEAVEAAEAAARITEDRFPAILDTLAAAHAAAEQFDDAVRVARTAIDLAREQGAEEMAEQIRLRLELYQQHRPYTVAP